MNADLLWTLILVPVSLLGVWLAARHWYGWAISAVSEFAWAAYALALHSTSLLIMSGVWLALHIRNTRRTFIDQFEVDWSNLQ